MRVGGTLAVAALLLAGLQGCTGFRNAPAEAAARCTYAPGEVVRVPAQTIAELTYGAVDGIRACLSPDMARNLPIVVASIADVQWLERSSAFGNIVADFARTRLVQNGMIVAEPRLRSAMLLRQNEGEMMLARDPKALVGAPPHSAILTGTYAVGDDSVFVSLKLIRADTAQILAAADFVARRTEDANGLLGLRAVARR